MQGRGKARMGGGRGDWGRREWREKKAEVRSEMAEERDGRRGEGRKMRDSEGGWLVGPPVAHPVSPRGVIFIAHIPYIVLHILIRGSGCSSST
jgi:hypothetical protein